MIHFSSFQIYGAKIKHGRYMGRHFSFFLFNFLNSLQNKKKERIRLIEGKKIETTFIFIAGIANRFCVRIKIIYFITSIRYTIQNYLRN